MSIEKKKICFHWPKRSFAFGQEAKTYRKLFVLQNIYKSVDMALVEKNIFDVCFIFFPYSCSRKVD